VLTARDPLARRTLSARVVNDTGGPARCLQPERTVDGLRERQRNSSFAYAIRTGKQQALRDPSTRHRTTQQADERCVADDGRQRHW